jgi:predicted nucleic acid-binding protein
MPKPRIYLDTTIPSAYHTTRTDAESVERRGNTRRWWTVAQYSCELLVSRAVLNELAGGRPEQAALRLALVRHLEELPSSGDILLTADLYVRHKLMPKNVEGDAMHLALASHHGCDVLATWNYLHLANPNKLDRIKRLNEELGLFVPRILTPLALMEESS